MSMSANLHRPTRAETQDLGRTWTVIIEDGEGNDVTLFTTREIAEAVASVFAEKPETVHFPPLAMFKPETVDG